MSRLNRSLHLICSRVALACAIGLCGLARLAAAETPSAKFTCSLFDGRSLAGWTVENGCEAGVEEGLLVLKAGNGWLRSDLVYQDFVLHVEWRALKSADYDSGIYIRTLPGGKPFPSTAYQV